MSVVIQKFLSCDGNSKDCKQNHGIDTFGSDDNATHWTLRRSAKQNGWVVFKSKDYCPVCSKQIQRIDYGNPKLYKID